MKRLLLICLTFTQFTLLVHAQSTTEKKRVIHQIQHEENIGDRKYDITYSCQDITYGDDSHEYSIQFNKAKIIYNENESSTLNYPYEITHNHLDFPIHFRIQNGYILEFSHYSPELKVYSKVFIGDNGAYDSYMALQDDYFTKMSKSINSSIHYKFPIYSESIQNKIYVENAIARKNHPETYSIFLNKVENFNETKLSQINLDQAYWTNILTALNSKLLSHCQSLTKD